MHIASFEDVIMKGSRQAEIPGCLIFLIIISILLFVVGQVSRKGIKAESSDTLHVSQS